MQEKVAKIIKIYSGKYPDPETELNYSSSFELLIATILSAQTTDKQVNKVTKNLFNYFNKPENFVLISKTELEEYIKSIGLYHNKSKYIIETSKKLLKEFDGKVPDTREELMKLSGVGRKTANVVMSCAFTKNAFPVDTHVFRVSNRIGLANSQQVQQVEEQLMNLIPKKLWSNMHHWLIFHGREICKAQNPKCKKCELNQLCDYYKI
jgi:endonuclease-3